VETNKGVSRRDLFQIAGSAAATAGLAAGQTDSAHAPAATAPPAPYRRKLFDEHQWRTVRVLCDLIIPAAQFQGGLAWLDQQSNQLSGKDFAGAAVAQQKQILDRIAWPDRAAAADHHGVRFFSRFRDLTVSGFFSSKMGVADLPYLGNRPVAQWKGCDPAVWAKIEERMKNGYQGLGGEVKPW